MRIYDFSDCPQNHNTYGGTAGIKVGVIIDGENFMIKYPGKLKGRNMKNVEITYSNSPVTEYIGCQIYGLLDIPVQETRLGIRNNTLVVACKDFLQSGESLVPYGNIKATFEPAFVDPQGDITNGTGTNINEIIRTFKEHPLLLEYPEAERRFWDMFVVDALVGNSDRNNENWGLIKNTSNSFRLAPVYDCGNSLNNKLSERQIQNYLNDPDEFFELAIKRPCIFERCYGKKICQYQFLLRTENINCLRSVCRIVSEIDIDEICSLIEDMQILSYLKKQFYTRLLKTRYEEALLPALYRAEGMFRNSNVRDLTSGEPNRPEEGFPEQGRRRQ